MHRDRIPARGSAFAAALTHFTIVAVLSAAAVWVVGFLSVPAYLIWSAGWDAGLWLVLGWVG